jgi:hypothetical protein
MRVEIIKSVLAQRCHGHTGLLQITDVIAAELGRQAIDVGAERCNDPLQRLAEIIAGSARRKLYGIDIPRPEISLAGHHDLAGFAFVRPGIGSAAEIHLLCAKQHDTDRAAGALRQAANQPGGAEGDGDAGAVVGGAGAEIPGIQMSTDQDDLIRPLRTLDLADDVPGRRILQNRRCQQQP